MGQALGKRRLLAIFQFSEQPNTRSSSSSRETHFMKYKPATNFIHAGVEPDPTTGAIMTPIYQTSTYVQEAPGNHKGYEYSRTGNPTRQALADALAAADHGKYGALWGSGMAAADAILRLFRPGDKIVVSNDLYGGSHRLMTQVFAPLGYKFEFVNMTDLDAVEKAIDENTNLVWIETPTNPLMRVVDIEKVVELGHAKKAIVAVDNTFASAYLQNPLTLGADIVWYSLTKYMTGHSDVVMGATITNDEGIHKQLKFIQNSAGAVPGPQDCFLALRSLKTLHVRMDRHCQNADQIARYLKDHPKIAEVNYPGLEDHPGHEIAKRQMHGFGGMLSFVTKGNSIEEAITLMTNVKLFALAESLGGVESLIGHPATMTHAAIPQQERLRAGLKDALIRLSVGIEDVEDLINDLDQALAKI
ncbi:MAG: cystathionine gamma-synthase [Bacteroidota bacterium]